MKAHSPLLATLILLSPALAAAEPLPDNLARAARLSASSQAGDDDSKYSSKRAADGDPETHWASAGKALPQWFRLEWPEPQQIDTVLIDTFAAPQANLYAAWKRFEVELSDGTKVARDLEPRQENVVVRLDKPHRIEWLKITLLAVHEEKTYVGADEVGVYLDPEQRIREPKPVAAALPKEAIRVLGGRPHPTVYQTQADVERARRNAEQTAWGKQTKASVLANAGAWLQRSEEEWLRFLPAPGACYAYGFTGCPICGTGWGSWGGARCAWDRPGTVQCAKGHLLPDADRPDDGAGYHNKDGRVHYFVGSWNAWVTEQWLNGIQSLAHAYALTGDERYAERAAFFLDALASIYAESTSGSWDYPSSPPSGRFARPWYQVARTLVPFAEGYDLVYNSKAFDKPSLRPTLEKGFAQGPTLQQRAVGTPDAHGISREGMTRRENVEANLMQDAAYYCYAHTFGGHLHNGHADYMRGALAVGVLLGIPTYVHNAVESPYSIYAMLANNCDRDGRYYETSLGYALHCRELYLTFTEPLRHWKDDRYPEGVDLFVDDRFRSFYLLPDLTMDVAGHSLNFGDCAPDHRYAVASDEKYSATDYGFAEHLYAGCAGAEKERFAQILLYLAGGDIERARSSAPNRNWLLYHADPVPAATKAFTLPPDLHRKVLGSWFLGQKGLAIARDGSGPDAQGALVRFGPSLNHGHLDDLGLVYYGKGWQCTYDIGYGLGSTHTQVGWARQTASHSLVTVDESPQSGGSGGSLTLFARLPGIKIIEADSPMSYGAKGVSEYRRTVALVGEGKDQYLIDLFRVAGGKQHDYILGSQGQDFRVAGVELGPEEKGSLAADVAWGEKQGIDADIVGFPNKPYWNPPPGNGYGFFYGVRRGNAAGPWSVDWSLGGPNTARFRAHVLPEGPAEAIVAKAPGLYPSHRNASYLMLRRKGDNLQSTFASVLEPYAGTSPTGMVDYNALMRRVSANQGDVVAMHSLGAFLLRGRAAGDFVECPLSVPSEGDYEVQARLLRYPSYATVRVLVDGKPAGEPYDANAPALEGPVTARFGQQRLAAGQHRIRVEITDAAPRYFIGIAGLGLVPAAAASQQSPEPKPILGAVERLAILGETAPSPPHPVTPSPRHDFRPAAVHVRRGDRDEFFASQAPLLDRTQPAPNNSCTTPAGSLQWSGGCAYVALRGAEVTALALHGSGSLVIGGLRIEPATAAFSGVVGKPDYAGNAVETAAPLPASGLEGEGVYFSNPRYSRNTAYRIERIEKAGAGSRILLGTQSMLLGQGRIADCPDDHTLTTEIPHDYARSVVGGSNVGFFNGKRLVAESGAVTHLTEVTFGTPMRLAAEDAGRFRAGDVVRYYDVQEGDAFSIPTAVWLSRTESGTWRLVSSVAVRLSGTVRTRKPGGAWTPAKDGLVPATSMGSELEVEWKAPGR